MDEHEPALTTRTLTDDGIERYLEHLRGQERAPATVGKYARALKSLAAALGGAPVTKAALVAWRDELLARCSPRTVNVYIVAANGCLGFMGLGAERLRLLRVQRNLFRDAGRDLTKAEYVRLVRAARGRGDERTALVIQTIASLGIRVSELRFVTVEAVRARAVRISSKGKCRQVPIPGALGRKLACYCRERGRGRGPVFATAAGRPIGRTGVWRAMKLAARAARVPAAKVFPHNLRHLFALAFWRASRDVVRLAALLGHSSIETTRVYLMEPVAAYARQVERMGLVV